MLGLIACGCNGCGCHCPLGAAFFLGYCVVASAVILGTAIMIVKGSK